MYIYIAMRRLYAVILLFPLMAFFAEAVKLPSQCPKMARANCPAIAKTQCPMMGKMNHQCMMAMMKRHGMETAPKGNAAIGQAAGSQEGKDTRKDGGCSVDCPVFSLATFKPLIRFELMRLSIKTEYTVMSDNNLSDYYKQHWKPPCGVFVA
jgi:hypothetical protein